jgi:putative resolvase
VSSSDQKEDVEGQVGRLVAFASARWLAVSRAVCEIGSVLNERRPKRLKLLADPAVQTIVVEQDMVEVLTSFCARLYGRGSARNRTKKARAALEAK